ncbi:UDP-glycosyltransferase 74F2 [Vitis vinifera]|uniref:UDP-glycosyltransferase 74F2 n=1 Tax=Vitis vinifera TaxID=29760 RepID=A0A438CVH9_VITVI|nr:UDP-glycosyltransferase 74F2 [Vitis vinifera]
MDSLASYGSFAELEPEHMEEVAWGLRRSNAYFLTVVGESQQAKLPQNFKEETVEKGLVVSWCPQLEVLAHRAIGCFLTNGGWNSTLEALSLGVPMVVAPGIVRREVLEDCIGKVMGSVDEGGSSDKCIDEFVAKLAVCSKMIYGYKTFNTKELDDSKEESKSSRVCEDLKEYGEGKENPQSPLHSPPISKPRPHKPMLQFSKRLVHNGAKVTLAATRFISKSLVGDSGPITIETISDGYDEGGSAQAESDGAYLERFQVVGSETLGSLIEKLKSSGCPVDCVVYDAFLPWALDGMLKLPLSEPEVVVPGLFPLQACDLPSFVYLYGSYPAFFDMVVNQFSNIEKVDWVFCNTFYKLEEKVVIEFPGGGLDGEDLSAQDNRPNPSSAYLDKRLGDDKDYGLNMLKPVTGACMEWLDSKPNGSVVYASYGSFAVLEPEQMEEVAWGLRRSNAYFLMVVRESEQAKLPQNFKEETAEKGLVVSWCPQLEALSLGVPMVVAPLWTDQPTNAKFVEDVWGIGLRARADHKGIVRREVLEDCIGKVMGSDGLKEIKNNAMKWKNLAREAVDEGGSSDKCIDEFVAKLAVW